MKSYSFVFSVLLLGMMGAISAQAQYIPVCKAEPKLCKMHISQLTQEELAAIRGAQKQREIAEEALRKLGDGLNDALYRVIKAHGLSGLPAHAEDADIFSHDEHQHDMTAWGTCMGSIKITDDGYLVFTPDPEIEKCDRKERP